MGSGFKKKIKWVFFLSRGGGLLGRLPRTSHHFKCLAMVILVIVDYGKHSPTSYMGLPFQLI